MNSRLSTVSPILVAKASKISPQKRLEIAIQIAEWACSKTHASFSFEQKLSEASRNDLQNQADICDEKYYEIIDRFGDEVIPPEATSWFVKARALSSLALAIEAKNIDCFCDVLYEAFAATDDLASIEQMMELKER